MALKYSGDYYKNPDLHIKKYLGEKKDEIFKKISKYDRLLLVAPTGSGKTALFRINTKELLKKYNRIIFVFPLLSIQSQLDEEWDTDLSINFEVKEAKASIKFEDAKKISSTYRSLYKVSKEVGKNDLVILDEIHTLFNDNLPSLDHENKDRVIRAFDDILTSQASVVVMSATPQVFISKSLGFESITATFKKDTQKRNIEIITIPLVHSYIIAQIYLSYKALNEDEKLLVYYKNTEKLKYYNTLNDAELKNDKAVITGAELRNNEFGIDAYLEDTFSENKIIYTTNAISTGVSIKDENIKKVLIFDVYESDEIVQVINRFRKVDELEISVLIDYEHNGNKRHSLDADIHNDIKYFSKRLRERHKTIFNLSTLGTIKELQLNLIEDRYKGVLAKQLELELLKYPNLEVNVIKLVQQKLNIDVKTERESYFKFTLNKNKLRSLLGFDIELGDMFNVFQNRLYSSMRSIHLAKDDQYEHYDIALAVFSEPDFKNASKKLFALHEILEDKILLENWAILNTSNVKNIEVGVIANNILGQIVKDQYYGVESAKWITHNYDIIEKAFDIANTLEKFKQKELWDDYFNNKHILHIDNKRIIEIIPKLLVSMFRSMFVVDKKRKKESNGEYFNYFTQPTFENAKPIADDYLVYAKEGSNDVLYVYDLDKTQDNLILQKHLSKVLVSKEEMIKNILNK